VSVFDKLRAQSDNSCDSPEEEEGINVSPEEKEAVTNIAKKMVRRIHDNRDNPDFSRRDYEKGVREAMYIVFSDDAMAAFSMACYEEGSKL
jgi:hypothetical protein